MAFFNKKKKEDIFEMAMDEEAIATAAEGVKTNLVFHPSQNYSTAQTYVIKFHHEQLPSLKPNQISISGIKLIRIKDITVIEAFIRNTLKQPMHYSKFNLIILDEAGKPLAKKSFDMTELGTIAPRSSIPWKFEFNKESLLVEEIPNEGWSIVFELKQPV